MEPKTRIKDDWLNQMKTFLLSCTDLKHALSMVDNFKSDSPLNLAKATNLTNNVMQSNVEEEIKEDIQPEID